MFCASVLVLVFLSLDMAVEFLHLENPGFNYESEILRFV